MADKKLPNYQFTHLATNDPQGARAALGNMALAIERETGKSNVRELAKRMDVSRMTLYRWLSKLGIKGTRGDGLWCAILEHADIPKGRPLIDVL